MQRFAFGYMTDAQSRFLIISGFSGSLISKRQKSSFFSLRKSGICSLKMISDIKIKLMILVEMQQNKRKEEDIVPLSSMQLKSKGFLMTLNN